MSVYECVVIVLLVLGKRAGVTIFFILSLEFDSFVFYFLLQLSLPFSRTSSCSLPTLTTSQFLHLCLPSLLQHSPSHVFG